ncbi:LysR family transcriptional regulator [Epibacterium ulvae]|uniref:LysR family transcriptional regulator n=1 Tax=Epibacterium ulvae TaxID=1156985 RepID=UPI001BFC7D71|nr:LysR family transcriptional regulator [Epibacterium ulvae]MBT8155335.1 LysR family transcriptional regulator [Epibacterium ulvae]
MDWMKMPPLSALRAFAAFAERGGVAEAGDSLNVSHAAISQQIRALEKHLDMSLVDRHGRALELTLAGHRLAQALQLGFGAIENAVQELAKQSDARPVRITCTPMFAAKWLMPRLGEFRERHPEIDLILDPTGAVVDMHKGDFDLAIRYGDGHWGGLEAEMFLPVQLVVTAAPALIAGRDIASPSDLLDLPWVEELGTTEAGAWMRSRGVDSEPRGPRVRLPGNLLLDAVVGGQGVAVKIREFVLDELASGRLVELFREEDARGYHIVTRPGVVRPAARKFAAWLRRQGTV